MTEVNETQFEKVENRLIHTPTGMSITFGGQSYNRGEYYDGSNYLLTKDGRDFSIDEFRRVALILGAGDYCRPE